MACIFKHNTPTNTKRQGYCICTYTYLHTFNSFRCVAVPTDFGRGISSAQAKESRLTSPYMFIGSNDKHISRIVIIERIAYTYYVYINTCACILYILDTRMKCNLCSIHKLFICMHDNTTMLIYKHVGLPFSTLHRYIHVATVIESVLSTFTLVLQYYMKWKLI